MSLRQAQDGAEFDGAVAIVTGGASGLGAATAALLHARGARVAVLDRNVDGVPAEFFTALCDVTDAEQVDAAVAAVAEHFGGIDIVVNNAGIGAAGDVTANDDAEWHRVLDVNVVGIARVSRAALPIWGVSTTLGSATSPGATRGSCSKTSSAAPAICFRSSAATSACSSTMGPRAVFTR